jgi:hypothetical protein
VLIPQYNMLFDRGLVIFGRRNSTIRISKAFPQDLWSSRAYPLRRV